MISSKQIQDFIEQIQLEAYADGRRDERQEREELEANVRGLQTVQLMQADPIAAWRDEAMKPDTAESVQASAIAENQSMQIPGVR